MSVKFLTCLPATNLCRYLIVLMTLLPSVTTAENNQPEANISGVWMAFAAVPAGRFTPTQAKLSAAGEAMVKQFEQTYGTDAPDPGAFCVPTGMPVVMAAVVGYPIEIIQQEKRITMLAEMEMQVRRIYLDGRVHPQDYPLTRIGHSVGRWEEGTLIIDTALLQSWETRYWPHSDAARIVENISLKQRAEVDVRPSAFIIQKPLDDDVLVNELSLIDPQIYEEPATMTIYYQRVADDQILEYDCPVDLWLQALEQHR